MDNEEQKYFSLMVSHHSGDEDKKLCGFETNSKLSYDELQNTFFELHAECLTLFSNMYKIIKNNFMFRK